MVDWKIIDAADVLPRHGGQLRAISARFGIPEEELLDFSANLSPDGPPAGVLSALQRSLTDRSTLASYPDLEQVELKRAIARSLSIPEDCISVANGFVPLLEAVLRVRDVHRCLLPVPAFNEYRRTLEKAGAEVVPFPLISRDDFRYDIAGMIRTVEESRCDAVLMANPQNPSGVLCGSQEMPAFVEELERRGVILLLDEAFIDYSPEHSITTTAATASNLIVFRSVTKFFAIPGLRVGYAVCESRRSRAMSQALAPWPVSTLASIGACAALGDEEFARNSRGRNAERRSGLLEQLQRLGHRVYPSSANFLLFALAPAMDAADFRERMIVNHRIVLRCCANYEGLEQAHFRAAVRTEQDNDRLVACLRACVQAGSTGSMRK